jgi:hypothetical protein
MKIFCVIWGIVATISGIYLLLGIWFPGLRGAWKRSKVSIGAVTSGGFGLLFISLGLTFLLGVPKPPWNIVALCSVVAAFLLISSGQLMDIKTRDAERRIYQLPGEKQKETPELRRSLYEAIALWVFVIIAALVIIFGTKPK